MENEEELKDIEIICRDCKKPFIHSVKDQLFYKEMNFQNMPKACPECRKAKKEANNKKNRYDS
ncbi:MAG: zinc-ribbon domain containing protein [Bacilli bacterium]|nr:zinc-ribbon domain containing protein [Bacilli bacterium]